MSDVSEGQKRAQARAAAERLVTETGITEAEATDLVGILGVNWPSLIRESRLLKGGR
jgi:hypothetical protein